MEQAMTGYGKNGELIAIVTHAFRTRWAPDWKVDAAITAVG